MSAGLFPPTRRSAVMSIKSDDPVERARSFEVVVRAYWKPVYKYVRVRWRTPPERSQDLTQGLFARAFERDYFARYDPEKARFRTFLKTCLDRFVIEQNRADSRLKRGGEAVWVSLDFAGAEQEITKLGSGTDDIDAYFEREWTRALFAGAVDQLRAHCDATGKSTQFAVFEKLALSDALRKPTYREVSTDLGIKVTDVTNYFAWARRYFREMLLDQLREITASDDEFREEATLLLGGTN